MSTAHRIPLSALAIGSMAVVLGALAVNKEFQSKAEVAVIGGEITCGNAIRENYGKDGRPGVAGVDDNGSREHDQDYAGYDEDAEWGFPGSDDETCDDGNRNNNDGCSSDCRIEECGDGITQEARGEQCDSGRECSVNKTACLQNFHCASILLGNNACIVKSGANCDENCKIICGNGKVDYGEQCDDGNVVDDDECRNNCKHHSCGDGVKGALEECDDGTTCPRGGLCDPADSNACPKLFGDGYDICERHDGDGCNNDCQKEQCGNMRTDKSAGEECDDGGVCPSGELCNVADPNACRGQPSACSPRSGDGCNEICKDERCGNGRTDAEEQCDAGSSCLDRDLEVRDCSIDSSFCEGECNVKATEVCDDQCRNIVCGNTIRQPGEECDDGNTRDGDGCSSDCENEICGNGKTDPEEDCDDGGTCEDFVGKIVECTIGGFFVCSINSLCKPVSGDGCDEKCHTECGNGVVTLNEQCDPGSECWDPMTGQSVIMQCMQNPILCGEGRKCRPIQNHSTCDASCNLRCGNGRIDIGEDCDDGSSCQILPSMPSSAGWGSSTSRWRSSILSSANQIPFGTSGIDCTGNPSICAGHAAGISCVPNGSGDGCSAFCKREYCGDGTADANGSDNAWGVKNIDDDGNGAIDDQNEAGYPGSDDEQCDWNSLNGSNCNAECKWESCGDGRLRTGEQCDAYRVCTASGKRCRTWNDCPVTEACRIPSSSGCDDFCRYLSSSRSSVWSSLYFVSSRSSVWPPISSLPPGAPPPVLSYASSSRSSASSFRSSSVGSFWNLWPWW